jgi:hypothetical protein
MRTIDIDGSHLPQSQVQIWKLLSLLSFWNASWTGVNVWDRLSMPESA